MKDLIMLVCPCLMSVTIVFNVVAFVNNVVAGYHILDGTGTNEDLNREDLLRYLDIVLYVLLVFIPVVIVVGLGYVLVELFSRALTWGEKMCS